jgi:hypothetical protein
VVDGHHIVHWTDGGTTDISNIVLLCHHRLMHHHGWRLRLEADEVTVTVTDPDGIARTSRPPGSLPLSVADRPDRPAARCTQIALARARARALRRDGPTRAEPGPAT